MEANRNNNWIRTFQVTQPVRHRKGFTVYKVVSKMFQRSYPEGLTTITVWKRYTDFRKLFTELRLIHSQLHLTGEFPKFPKAKVFGRFDYEVVEERRKAALALLEFSARHNLLFASKVFSKFFEDSYNTSDLLLNPNLSENESSSQHEDYETQSCLMPERLWCQPNPPHNIGNGSSDDIDGHSSSSVDDTQPRTASNTTDSDSILSSAAVTFDRNHIVSDVSPLMNSTLVTLPSESSVFQPYESHQISINSILLGPSDSLMENNSSSPVGSNNSVLPCSKEGIRPVSTSLSCSSLTSLDIPVISRQLDKSESSNDLQNCTATESSTNRHNLRKARPNGYGFFDFLPKFSHRNGKNREGLQEDILSQSLNASYICEAAGHFAVAQRYESNHDFQRAFRSYKDGIRILLVGAKDDTDINRKRLVKSKLDRYLNRAEFIHENYLTLSPNPSTNINASGDYTRVTSVSPVSFNSEKLWQNTLAGDTQFHRSASENMRQSPIQELKEYKLVRIISQQVYLVVNIRDRIEPTCYAIKILLKSSSPLFPDKPLFVPNPNKLPFMVKPCQWFETTNSYIVVMQYAGGGQLKKFVELYQTKSVTPIDLERCRQDQNAAENNGDAWPADAEPTNPSATISELSSDMLSVLDAFAEYGSDKENCESYNRLFEEYSESIQDTRTHLATFSKHEAHGHVHEVGKSEKETSEIISDPSVASFDAAQSRNFEEPTIDSHLSFLLLPSFDEHFHASEENSISNTDAAGTEKLIESSKVLLQAVNQTLASGKCSNATTLLGGEKASRAAVPFSCKSTFEDNCRLDMPSSSTSIKLGNFKSCSGNTPMRDELTSYSKNNVRGAQCINPCTNTAVDEEDEGIQSSCEGSEDGNQFQAENKSPAKVLDDLPLNSSHVVSNEKDQEDENLSLCEMDGIPIPQRMVPECCIKIWAAEIVLALENLHNCGLSFGDLELNNILLGENGHILLSLASQWPEVDQSPEIPFTKNEFIAPEIRSSLGWPKWKIHPSSDFWSLGVILFELVTGQTLNSAHPEGFLHSDTILRIPDKNLVGDLISHDARTLLAELLQFTPSLRLGYYGAAEVKSHPFFKGFDWESALEAAIAE